MKSRRTQAVIDRSDSKIEKSVEVALAYDPRVAPFELKVAVVGGEVNLSGEVDNSAAKTAAEQTARNTVGVTTVKNYITVQSDFPSNAELQGRIATAIENDSVVNRRLVNILAENGWIYLSGAVNTSAQRTRAKSVAQRQFGVLGVVNNIVFERTWIPKPDWEIRADVRSQLRWDAFVDASEVTVTVQDGIVTLTGTVDSLTEKNEAKKNAFQGGAKAVKNKIEVEYPYYGPYGPTYYGGPYFHSY